MFYKLCRGISLLFWVMAVSGAPLHGHGETLSVRRFSMADGLSGPNVRKVVCLPSSHLIIVQEEGGASLFDGERFQPLSYTKDKTLPVQSFFSGAHFVDTLHNRLWLRDFHTLSAYDTRTCRQIDLGELLPLQKLSLTAKSIFIDDSGSVWFLSRGDTLYYCPCLPDDSIPASEPLSPWYGAPMPAMDLREGYEGSQHPTLCDVVQVGESHYALLSNGQVVCLKRSSKGIRTAWRVQGIESQTAYTLRGKPWGEHSILLLTTQQLVLLDTRTRLVESIPMPARITDFQRVPAEAPSSWPAGGLVAATLQGLVCYDSLLRPVDHVLSFDNPLQGADGSDKAPSTSHITSLTFDHEGGLWMTSFNDGLYYHSPLPSLVRFMPLRDEGGQPVEVRSLEATADGHALAATSAGLYRLNAEGQMVPSPTLPALHYLDISPDWRLSGVAEGGGFFWLTSMQGRIFLVDAEGNPCQELTAQNTEGLTGNSPFCLRVDSACLLTSIRQNRLSLILVEEGRLESLEAAFPRIMDFRYVVDACPMDGGYLVGTQNGFFFFDNATRSPLFDRLETLNANPRSDKCTCLLQASDGFLWIGTQRDLFRYDEHSGRLDTYTQAEGLPDDCIQSLAEDAEGYIWVATATGIVRLSPAIDGEEEPIVLTGADGIGSAAFMEHSACHLPAAGQTLFGARGGIYVVDAHAILHSPAVSLKPVVLAVNAGDTLLPPQTEGVSSGAQLRLSHEENTISFSVSALTYAQPQHVIYRYRLRPSASSQDNGWEESRARGGNLAVTYRLLPPGRYVFEVQARLQGQQWGEITTFSLRILPPWWLSIWAWLVYLLLLGALISLVVRHFVRQHDRRLEYDRQIRTGREREQMAEEKMRFLTHVTHELRTPLTLILGPLEDLSEDESLSDRARERTRRISDSAHRLLTLVNRLLELRKTETGHRQINLRNLDLAVHCREQLRHFAYMNQSKRVQFVEDIEAGEIVMPFDPEAMTSILSNLLSNALKSTSSGTIRLSLKRQCEQVCLQVSDTGIGIPQEELSRIFELYYQSREGGARGGTGIGLSIAKSLVLLHHGKISVESQQGKGTTFTITLPAPLNIPQTSASSLADVPSIEGETSSTDIIDTGEDGRGPLNLPSDERAGGFVALVVEDNAEICRYLTELLAEGDGKLPEFRVLAASDGREGAEIALAEVPDIILTDVMMPEMDGVQLCKLLKKDIRTSHIPVIMLTAKDSIRDKEAGYEAGADAYLTKPFTPRMLRALLSNIFSTREALRKGLLQEFARSAALAGRMLQEEGEEAVGRNARQAVSHEVELSTLDRRFIDELNKIIDDNLDNPQLDVLFLCDRLFVSRTTLYRKVRALLGMAANVYIRKKRLHKANAMLHDPAFANRTVTSIAYDCGFASIGHFRSCFKEEFGVIPTSIKR